MKLPYERPEAEVIDFRAMEAIAADDETGPGGEVNLSGGGGGGGIGGDLGVEDWDWSGN